MDSKLPVKDQARAQLALMLDLMDRHDDERVREVMARASESHDDEADAAGAALLVLLRASGQVDVDRFAAESWLQLRPGQRAALLLIEVEQVPVARAAALLAIPGPVLQAAYSDACREFGWEPLERVSCPGWPTVARMHRVGTEDGTAALIHVRHCHPCAVWHIDRQKRRVVLADLAPFVGASGLGFRWDPASI